MVSLAGDLGEVSSGFEVFAVPASTAHGGSEGAGGERRRTFAERCVGEDDECAGGGGPAPVQVTLAHEAGCQQAEQQPECNIDRQRGGAVEQMLDRP